MQMQSTDAEDFQMRQNPDTSSSVVITSDSLGSLTVEVLLTPAS